MAQQVQLLNRLWFLLIGFIACNAKEPTKPMLNNPVVPNQWVHIMDSALNNRNGVIYYQSSPYSGKLYELYSNQRDTAFVRSYLLGKEEGEWKSYYENGQIKELRFFSNGKKMGKYLVWWPNGKPFMQYQFESDEYQGTCKEWNEKGLLVKQMNYHQGHELVSQKWWYDNGKIKANYIIQNGRRFGLLGTKNCINVTDSIFKN